MPTLLISLTVLSFLAAHWLLLPDSRTRNWLADRACIFTAGLFIGLGLAGTGCFIYLVTA